LLGRAKFLRRNFPRGISARSQLTDPALIDIKSDHRPFFTELDCEGKTDITEADHCQFRTVKT
jgi:hypothetical protein